MIREVTKEEVKMAMFSIGDNKSPGPDGYSAAFYKKAWEIVGNDVYLVVRDFFMNGCLLKELNHTSIVLIPKVTTPAQINDFRPISLCNVLYKCISKILTNRIKDSLGDIISENQSAFVPGRSISDNILLTQELMRGYHLCKGPPRSTFKVDIQKAYDTVNWCFLRHILHGFGFHPHMIKLIMACVTSVSYSINLHGHSHGFFKGGRGLRQGDPMSPYLFTLVMEILTLLIRKRVNDSAGIDYHIHCDKQKIVNICFADDLFLFCRGNANSVQIISQVLNSLRCRV